MDKLSNIDALGSAKRHKRATAFSRFPSRVLCKLEASETKTYLLCAVVKKIIGVLEY